MQNNHLPTSHECPVVTRHKMILFLSATKNIPLVDARRKILQSTLLSNDPKYNFLLLNSGELRNANIRYSNSPNFETIGSLFSTSQVSPEILIQEYFVKG